MLNEVDDVWVGYPAICTCGQGDGYSGKLEGEAFDRVSISLPGWQRALVDAVVAAQPRTIVVFMCVVF